MSNPQVEFTGYKSMVRGSSAAGRGGCRGTMNDQHILMYVWNDPVEHRILYKENAHWKFIKITNRKHRSRRVAGTESSPWNLVFQSALHGKLHPDACWVALPSELHSLLSLLGGCCGLAGLWLAVKKALTTWCRRLSSSLHLPLSSFQTLLGFV